MEIQNVSIAQETRNRLSTRHPLNRLQKTRIREEGVIKFIRNKPSGELIAVRDLINAAGYSETNYANGWQFIDNMVRKGIITKMSEVGTHKSSYCVNNDAKVTVPKQYSPSITKAQRVKNDFLNNTKQRGRERSINGRKDVEEYVSTFEPGTHFTHRQLSEVGGYPYEVTGTREYWAAVVFVQTLVDKGIVHKFDRSRSGFKYAAGKGFNTPRIVKKEVIAEFKPAENIDELPPQEKASDENAEEVCTSDDKQYSITVVINKRHEEGEFGKRRVAELEMSDITLGTARYMTNKLFDNVD